METQNLTGKINVARLKQLAATYKAPLIVFGIILAAISLDYAFRSSDTNYYAKGVANMQTAKYDAAIKDFSRALRQNSADPAAHFGLGWAYHGKGWVDEALKEYELAVRAADDALYLSQFNAGVIYQQKRKLDEAAASYQKAVLANPTASGAIYNLGFIYADRGQNEQALQQFLRTIQLDPRNATAHYNAGLMAERLGRKDDAKRYYQTALAIDANFAGAKDRLKAL